MRIRLPDITARAVVWWALDRLYDFPAWLLCRALRQITALCLSLLIQKRGREKYLPPGVAGKIKWDDSLEGLRGVPGPTGLCSTKPAQSGAWGSSLISLKQVAFSPTQSSCHHKSGGTFGLSSGNQTSHDPGTGKITQPGHPLRSVDPAGHAIAHLYVMAFTSPFVGFQFQASFEHPATGRTMPPLFPPSQSCRLLFQPKITPSRRVFS